MACLFGGLAIGLAVEDDDREIGGLLQADGWQGSRSPSASREPNHHGAAHSAPEVEIARMTAGSCHVVGGCAPSTNCDRTFAILQKAGDDGAAIETVCSATSLGRCGSPV